MTSYVTEGQILFVTTQRPVPAVSGDKIRVANLIKSLAASGWSIHLFCLGKDQSLDASSDGLMRLCTRVCVAPFAPDRRQRAVRIAKNLARRRAFHETYFWSPEAQTAFDAFIDGHDFDGVVLSQLYMYPYLPSQMYPITILDTHNSEVLRLQTMIEGGNRLRSLIARAQRAPVWRYETEASSRVFRTLAVSQVEADHFSRVAEKPAFLAPNGVDLDQFRPRERIPDGSAFVFLGSLSYGVNQDALMHLINDILPYATSKQAKLTVAGSGAPAGLEKRLRSVSFDLEYLGFVPSTLPLWRDNKFLVVPLRFGGGTRLKILEAMASGVPVISTKVGCEGLRVRHGHDIIIASDPQDFAGWIDRLLVDSALLTKLAENGRRTVEDQYGWSQTGQVLNDALRDLLHQSNSPGSPVERGY